MTSAGFVRTPWVRSTRAVPFQEDEWLGGVLTFGEGDDAPP